MIRYGCECNVDSTGELFEQSEVIDSNAELFEQSGDIGSNDELFENCAALGSCSALHCCELVVVNLPQFSEVYKVCSLHPV